MSKPITRVGELREYLKDFPDDTYIGRCQTMGGEIITLMKQEGKELIIDQPDICYVPLTNKIMTDYIQELEETYAKH